MKLPWAENSYDLHLDKLKTRVRIDFSTHKKSIFQMSNPADKVV